VPLRYTLLRCWPLTATIILSACGTTRPSRDALFVQKVMSSRDSTLHYQLPVNWVDATADAPASDNLIWLIRPDFTAMLTVREVRIDDVTRREIAARGLERLGDLLLSLASSESGVQVSEKPAREEVKGMPACSYAYIAGHPRDYVHVILVDSGRKIYEVSVRTTGVQAERISDGVVALQKAFVERMRW